MDLPDEDRLLVEMIGRLGGAGAAGARFTARRLKKDVQELALSSELTATAAIALAQQIIYQAGGSAYGTAQLADGTLALRGVIGVGMGGLNPAVVTFTVRPQDADGDAAGSFVHVRAAAKEGLIKQHGGHKAADRIVEGWTGADPTARIG